MDTRRALAHIQRATELLGFGSSQSRKAQQKRAAFGVIDLDLVELNLETVKKLNGRQPPEAGQLFRLVKETHSPPGSMNRPPRHTETRFLLRYKRMVCEGRPSRRSLTHNLIIPAGTMIARYTLEMEDGTILDEMTIPVNEREVSESLLTYRHENAENWIEGLPGQVGASGELLIKSEP